MKLPDKVKVVLAHPMTQTFAFLIFGYVAFLLLGMAQGDDDFTSANAWTVWKASAAIAVAVALVLGGHGVATVSRVAADPDYEIDGRRAAWYCVAGLLLVAGVGYFLATVQGRVSEDSWQITNMHERLTALAAVASLPAAPWIALVWIAHRAERADHPDTSTKLEHRWQLIVSCAQAFAVFVVIALIPTGALRAAFLAQSPDDKSLEKAFPASDVLIYGGFYALLIVVITLPLVMAWRSRAQKYVNAEFPLDAKKDDEWEEGRLQLEKLHHLDVSLLRNPLTALSVLTPLVTATLAYFLPALAK